MSFFKKKRKYSTSNCWVCPKCKTDNSYNTNVCITCHTINHNIKANNGNVGDSFLFKKSSEPENNNCPPPSTTDLKAKRYKCSQCGLIYNAAPFCPDCGARAHTTASTDQYINSLSDKERRQVEKTSLNKAMLSDGHIKTWSGFTALSGLPIPPKAKCSIRECNEKLIICYDTSVSFSLDYTKIINIECVSSTEVQKHYVDNTSKAIAGGMLFGFLGAMICGVTKTIVDTATTYFLAITYNSSNELKYLIFDVTDCYAMSRNFIKQIKEHIGVRTNKSLEL